MRVRWNRRRGSFAAAVTVPALVVTLALLQDGFPVARLDLDDGGVWLTSAASMALGRYNVPVEELDGGLSASGSVLDVAQDGSQVLLVEPATISLVDTANVAVTTRVPITTGDTVAMAGGTVLVTSHDGGVWLRTVADLAGLDVATGSPDLALGAGGAAVVAQDGTVLTATASGATSTLRPAAGGATQAAGGPLHGTVSAVDQLTAVGDEPVVLDGHTVRTRSGQVELDGDQLTLQRPGPAADSVLVASADALYEVPLDGGRPVEHRTTGSGRPAAPVRVGACSYAAWASVTGNWMRLCGSTLTDADREGVTSADTLVFRVNRGRVVLNDVATGRAWLPQDPRVRVPDWKQITPQQTDTTPDENDGTQVTQAQSAQCSQEGAPPSAADDTFGVRPGRTTVLPVLDNDSTSDCGILVISSVDPLPPAFGTLQVVQGGRALQVELADGASGEASFTYTVTDRPGTRAPATASVHLKVRDAGQNEPPHQVRTSTVQVEQGGSLDQDVLSDFRDPDGDALVLVGASMDPTYGTVTTRSDGTLTVHAGGLTGNTVVTVQVSDGIGDPVSGTVDVQVRDLGSLVPQIDPVHAVGYVNQAVVVSPLKAVRSVTAEPARLAGVGDVPGATITPNLQGGTFSFTATRAGTYYVSFTVVASPTQATGWARIDVEEYPDQVRPPVAMADRALLPAGGSVTVDPLANDEDPSNLVLVLQDVTVPDGSGLHVAVIEHHLVQITADRVLDRPVSVPYTVSNGASVAVGSILVQSVTAPAISQPPVVPDVEATVRTGAVVTIAALDGAYDPGGGDLTLSRTLPEPLAADQGLLFVSGDVLRYQAPATPMTVSTVFQVTNSAGVSTAARLTVRVHASDAATKVAPTPQPVVARVFESETVRIPIPLHGIDADGDGVTLLGLGDSAPQLGIVTAVGADYLEYRALPGSSGTDKFTYAVEDWTGQRAVGQVRVGVSPRPTTVATVVARDDAVTVAPGRTVEVRVLANDVDSGGGDLQLADSLALSGDTGSGPDAAQASVQGTRVVVRAPPDPGVLTALYTARNARGGQDTAVLTVTVAADAPVLPPIAQDVVVPATETIGRTQVDVDVLAVAQNPSGPLDELRVVVPSTASAVARVVGGKVEVTLADQAQTLPYQLVNSRDPSASSYAFITVPALGFFPPAPRPKAPALRVASGAELRIPLDTQVQVAPGRTASIADATKVTATRSDGSSLVVDPSTLRFVSAAGYAGPASITVPVTDSTGPGDPDARQSTLTLSITVYATDEHPPTFTPSTVEVGPGETPLTVDLTAFMRTPEGDAPKAGDYGYKLTDAVPAGFTVTLSGPVLRVGAAATTARGTSGTLSLAISYGTSGSLPVTLPLVVRASTRPLARVQDQALNDGVAGRDRTVRVLDGAFNPFADQGGSLVVVSATVETAGAGSASTDGTSVTVHPAGDFVGTMVTRFRVRDMTMDADREVEGRVELRVSTLPDAPAAPHAQEVRDQAVVLAWSAPGDGGSPVLGYRVVADPGGITTACATTVCTIGGLTNGTDYTFTVAAQNAVGWSPASAPSAAARPDAVPDPPDAPALSSGNGTVSATWQAPVNHGSAIVSYQVEISPAPTSPDDPAVQQATSTSATFAGLQNGQAYSVRVRALNRSPVAGGWSPWSATAVPSAVPSAPTDLTASRVDTPAGGQIAVSWSPAASNGSPLLGYTLTISGGGLDATEHLDAGATGYALVGAANGVPYTFTLVASNARGVSPAATTSASTFGVPGSASNVVVVGSQTASPPGQATATVHWGAADPNGSPITTYRLTYNGVTVEPGDVRSTTITGLPGGQQVTVQVQACNAAGCGAVVAGTSRTTPLTVPSEPRSVAVQVAGVSDAGLVTSVAVSWQPPADWGQAQAGDYVVTLAADGAQIGSAATAGSSTTLSVPARATQGKDSATFTATVVARSAVGSGAAATGSVLWQATLPAPDWVTAWRSNSGPGTHVLVGATWAAVSGQVDHYEVQASVGAGAWSTVATVTGTQLDQADLGVIATGTSIGVQVRAVSPGGLPGDWKAAATMVAP